MRDANELYYGVFFALVVLIRLSVLTIISYWWADQIMVVYWATSLKQQRFVKKLHITVFFSVLKGVKTVNPCLQLISLLLE